MSRIIDTGTPATRIDPEEFAAAMGAELVASVAHLDPITLIELGNELLRRLRSTGGRPALDDATETIRVPLSAGDVAALARVTAMVSGANGAKPSLGQVASAILRLYLAPFTAMEESTDGNR